MNCTACGTRLPARSNFCPQCGARRPSDAAPAESAEKRQTTVLLCDIVDSTTLVNSLDPEDARELLVRAQRLVRDVVHRHKGVADHSFDREEGDSQLFCFGLPHAQEDAAERAARAALEAVAEIERLRVIPGVALRVRIGVATGVVVVGQGPGKGRENKPVLTGAAPNLAARLQAAAAPNTVLISGTTRRLLGNLFDCVSLGALRLKGFDEPVDAWRVDGPSDITSRFDALHPSGSLSPLVGREREIGALLDRWELVREGIGQAVAIDGEPGIGKSRLLNTMVERLKDEVATVLLLQCSPYHVNTAFYPVARGLERVLALAQGDHGLARQAQIESLLEQRFGRPAEDARLIAEVLAVAVEKVEAVQAVRNAQRKQDTIAALVNLLESISLEKCCMVLLEDAHWSDPSTCEFLAELVARAPRCRMLILVTHRPEFDARQVAGAGLGHLALSRLSRDQATVLASRLAAGKSLPVKALDRIIERSDGIPLFVEELTHATIEGSESAGRSGTPQGDIPVPATLRDSLMSRLDRLPAGKTVAQIGAVIGREFSRALLSAITPLPRDRLEQALHSLTLSGLMSLRSGEHGPTYVFKHALLQDVARDSLLRSARRELNAKVARTVELRFPQTAAAQPELLAHYYGEAEVHEQAVEYWMRAGDQATQRSANLEAINQLERALEFASKLPDGPARKRQELEVYVILARATIAAKGYASPEVAQIFARARELFPHVTDSALKFSVVRGECQMLVVQARYDLGLERAHELLRLATEENDPAFIVDAQQQTGLAHLYRGSMQLAREHLERCAKIYDPALHLQYAVRQGMDIGSAALAYLARALWILGYPDQALRQAEAAMERTRTPNIPLGLAQASGMLALVLHARGDLTGAKAWTARTLQYATDHGQPYWIALAHIVGNSVRAQEQPSLPAVAALAQSIAQYRATGAKLGVSWALLLLAEASDAAGLHEQADGTLCEALAHIGETGEGYYAAEAYRLEGEFLFARAADARAAEARFLRALETARRQQARSWELRAAMSMARLWQREGRDGAAYDLLHGVYVEFDEGHSTADLRGAASLLTALAARRSPDAIPDSA